MALCDQKWNQSPREKRVNERANEIKRVNHRGMFTKRTRPCNFMPYPGISWLLEVVDLAMGVCECVARYDVKMCKHQRRVIVHCNLINDQLTAFIKTKQTKSSSIPN